MRLLPILLAGLALALSACGGKSSSEADKGRTPPTVTTTAAPPKGAPAASDRNPSRPTRKRAKGPKRRQSKTVLPNPSRQRELPDSPTGKALEDSGVIP